MNMIQTDIPIPRNCFSCCFARVTIEKRLVCVPSKKEVEFDKPLTVGTCINFERPVWCPLKEVGDEHDNG